LNATLAAFAPVAIAGCNAIAGIGVPHLDRCIDDPGGSCATGAGGAGGASASSASASSTSSVAASSSTGPAQPVCGNGVLEAGEQCDDGNVTDGDGCSSHCQVECMGMGLYLDPATFHCYRFVVIELPWGEARDACLGAHEHLATFTSAEELDAVAPHAPGQWWIDGIRSGPGFAWADGEPWSFDRWKGGFPSTDPSKGCVKLDGGEYSADDCAAKMNYLCERDPAGT
jgi:cysteine-rich repeat protein